MPLPHNPRKLGRPLTEQEIEENRRAADAIFNQEWDERNAAMRELGLPERERPDSGR